MSAIKPAASVSQVIALRQQVLDQTQSLQQLRDASGTTKAGLTGNAEAADQAKPAGGFASSLDNALEQVNQTQIKSSEMSAAYQRGEVTDVAQVMLARQESGIAFEATLQVRNKLLNAYQDIMRMGI